jgi:hypothetical protein
MIWINSQIMILRRLFLIYINELPAQRADQNCREDYSDASGMEELNGGIR